MRRSALVVAPNPTFLLSPDHELFRLPTFFRFPSVACRQGRQPWEVGRDVVEVMSGDVRMFFSLSLQSGG